MSAVVGQPPSCVPSYVIEMIKLLMRWPCEADVRVGGQYRFVFGHGDSKPVAFFGKYIEVTPHSRLVWTNDEAAEGGPVTTLTLEEKAGKTLLVLHDLYPSKEALDAAMASGEKSGMGETFDQLDELLVALRSS